MFRYFWRSRSFHVARIFFFVVFGFKIPNLEPILIALVGGFCNVFVLIRGTRACLVDTETSSFSFNGLCRFLIVASFLQLHSLVGEIFTSCLPFSITLTQRFRTSIIGIFSQPGFFTGTCNLGSCFLSTFPVTSCSEIKLSELSIGLLLLFGACFPVSCWVLLMAVRSFLVTRC